MNVIEQCRITPPDAAAELSLPLTFFDMLWLDFFPGRRLLFYEFPCSKSDFVGRIIPDVKRSLSLSLKHFPPFAGNFLYPSSSSSKMPEIQFSNGDSVSVVFAESDADFSYLTGNQPRNSDKFYHLLPELPPTLHADGGRIIPILSAQVTLFPNRGVSLGLTLQHVVGDASTTVNFIKSWASICKTGGDAEFLADQSLHPLYDRRLINGPYGDLAEKYWNDLKSIAYRDLPPIRPETKVRATFVMDDSNIQKLKSLAAAAPDPSRHVSTLAVTCGYVWSCLAKSGAAVGEEDGTEYFTLAADFRSRLIPPLPAKYFGNCIGPLFAKSPRSRLIGDGGYVAAAKLIGEAIYERCYCNKEDVLKVAADWQSDLRDVDWSRNSGTVGSPRFNLYEIDFGWGRPEKFEAISIDADGSMSLSKSRESEKNLEIGLSLPIIKMDAFVDIFNHGLTNLVPS